MKDEMTHERCSELLGSYVRDELADGEASAVEGHLAACVDCRQEMRGLTALLDYQFEGLTGTELVRLERSLTAVMKADRDQAATVTPIEPRSESRRNFAGAILGAAATLLVVTFAILSLQGGGGDGDGGGDSGAAAPQSDELGGGAAGDGGPHPVFVAGTNADAFFSEESEDNATKANRNAALADASAITDADLTEVGTSRLFQRFAAAYDSEDAAALQDQFVSELAQGAGGNAGAVTLCSRNTLEASTGPALPVVGSFTRFEGERALLLGFIYTDQTEGPLNRYSVWVWPQGSCDSPLRTASGNVP